MRQRNIVGIGLIVVALAMMVYLVASGDDPQSLNPGFFSDDGGKSFFMDVTSRITPFVHNGKEAVHADVFTCDANEMKFVGYLDRYTPEMKERLEHPPTDEGGKLELMREAAANGVEIAAPGSDRWFNRNSAEAKKIMDGVRCPKGSQNNLTFAWPGKGNAE